MKKRKVVKKKDNSLLKLNANMFALSCALVSSFLVTLTVLAGMWGHFPFLNLILSDMYGSLGFTLTWQRVFLATVYSLIDAFLASLIFALIYNRLIK